LQVVEEVQFNHQVLKVALVALVQVG